MRYLSTSLFCLFLLSGFITNAQNSGENTEEVYTIVEVMPEFPGGQDALLEFLIKNVKYPSDAKDLGLSGTVYLSFVVGEDGKVRDNKILKSVYPLLDEEAMRVVKLMPKWKPGKQGGKPVNVYINLPIKFTLTE